MKRNKILKLLLVILIISFIIIFSIFLINKYNNKKEIEKIYEVFLNLDTQEYVNKNNDLSIDVGNYENLIGIIKINKIGFEGLIYEGTDLNTLDKGVGHFKSSPILDGNVCLAAHNSVKFWAKLNELEINDIINYNSVLGTKEYIVYNIQEIDETDWSLLENTEDNNITLITCIRNTPNKRLCVQAKERK